MVVDKPASAGHSDASNGKTEDGLKVTKPARPKTKSDASTDACHVSEATSDHSHERELESPTPAQDDGHPAGVCGPILTIDDVPQRIRDTEYAVRGAVVARSWELAKQLRDNPGSLPFSEIIPANIGNPQAVGQKPIAFNRQVLACVTNPHLMDQPGLFPADVVSRARSYLKSFPSFGAYSHSKGIPQLREDIARWFTKRDGILTDPEHIMLTDGASPAVRTVLELLLESSRDGVMIPIPHYPLYSATITRLGGRAIGYYLKEEDQWGLDMGELQGALDKARQAGGRVRALVVINPGNPTGGILTRQQMVDVVEFCEREKLVLLADEVYQDNVYLDEKPFVPFRRVLADLSSPLELFTFHSSSKGVTGECGVRGGLLHAHNVDEAVIEQLYKLFSISLCANTLGQAMIASILTPPEPGSPSYDQYTRERRAIFSALQRKAILVHRKLNEMKGVSCQRVEGAMYAFPRIELPPRAIEAARQAGQQPDMFYCLQLLEHTGVIVVPGSGFGQRPGSLHYRMTILPEESKLGGVLDRIKDFHDQFLAQYS
ncbi:unnamed protein product [Vitrella brassicaformis CCMP3155]|uniref:Aminotransferase class I/classII large domain-containing protein n=1 Tax=Vitrella brassicaformis (strain CCMP3155) TaxID=1169540 RepID=A0A0G4EW57_VITBC|nr:unnamed protein product [Vitrella brassicaformis CCMP3155]|mmetsp:Transcript_21385/g.52350  ORF Transcript_21385/g.52350 Transcript_21385/m.52350 type:complete len:546 (-) Transcript_21385:27-1664(-)|eukprot:CEM02687.1 unnamed protein product [Vitrella brassicaformis CCMP3155]